MEPDSLPALHPVLAGLITQVHENHQDMIALVRGVDIEGLKWMPIREQTAHLSGLVLHVLEVENYLAGLAEGSQEPWTATLGSSNTIVMKDTDLVARIEATDIRLKKAIGFVGEARLAEFCPDGERTVAEALIEDLAHSSQHIGQMQLTRQLMAKTIPMDFPPYERWA
ncbi:MAG: hypothetical protein IT301_04385 [Dehalococcoidia bacterium]|nr:hypothetical protein [Dehalococcoidia bacterium]